MFRLQRAGAVTVVERREPLCPDDSPVQTDSGVSSNLTPFGFATLALVTADVTDDAAWIVADSAALAVVASIAVASSSTAQKNRMYKAFIIISDWSGISVIAGLW